MSDIKRLSKDPNVGEGGHGVAKKGQYAELPSKVKPKGGVIQGHGELWCIVCSASGKAASSQVGIGGCGGRGDDDCSDDGGGLGGGLGGWRGGRGGGDANDDHDHDHGHGAPTSTQRRAHGSAKVECEWKIWLERVTGGVAVAPNSTFKHNTHELARNATEKAAAAATRDDIPADVLDEAQTWAARVPLSAVVDILRDKHAVDGKKPDWLLKDFSNKLAPTVAEVTLDATRFVAELIEMRTSGFRTFFKTHVTTAVLLCAMICFPEAMEDHAVDGATCDVYDLIFNTNRRNYKLGVFDQPSFACVLRWYAEVFGSHPLTLITDGDYALHLAIIEVLGTYFAAWCHILCVWHIAQLVAKHVKHTFGAAVAGKRGGGSDKRWNKFNSERCLALP
ncbi:hypothetical protein T492DRAFT_869337 [Pavlovales sp. CCMP2436]|nr:hypothetical protein T492DRAFT_869337 [Pavlovales sp. CCMP2436]